MIQADAQAPVCTREQYGEQRRLSLCKTWWQGESRRNEFNNVQCSLKRSSQPLRRCHSCQISGAEISLALSANRTYGLSAWQHRDPQQMCCFFFSPVLDVASLSHLCFLRGCTITSTNETVISALRFKDCGKPESILWFDQGSHFYYGHD